MLDRMYRTNDGYFDELGYDSETGFPGLREVYKADMVAGIIVSVCLSKLALLRLYRASTLHACELITIVSVSKPPSF